MFKYLRIPSLAICFLLFLPILASGQEVIRFKALRANADQKAQLAEHFKAYTLATLGTEQVSNLLRSRDFFTDLKLEINGKSYSFNLMAKDIRAPHYKLRALTANGVVEWPRSPNKTYFGFTHSGQYDVRITADDNYFSGLIAQDKKELFIHPARQFLADATKNEFVIYWSDDAIKQWTNDACGVTHEHTPASHSEDEGMDAVQQESSSRACKVVQIALADDHLMFEQYGSIPAVENHNLTVINNVLTNYDFEFNDDLQFDIVEIFVTTNDANDPWSNLPNINTVLNDFTAWGPTGFSNTHDVAGLWSDRNFSGDVIGLAWLNAVCTNVRYHVMENFTDDQAYLRCLQAHEMGHNFSAGHDGDNATTIMAPFVQNTNTWSNASINSINSYINQISCLSACGTQQAPIANFTATPTSGCAPMVVQFTDLSQNNPTSWTWTFPGGTPSSSTVQNPTVTYNTPGNYNVTLLVSNNQGSNSLTLQNFISVGQEPFADFDYDISENIATFQNLTTGATSYFWTFGDGGTSTQQHPVHVYADDGFYLVTLTATNSCGSDNFSQTIQISTLPIAAFSSDITEGCEPIEIEFINLSSDNADFFSWSFPGGTPAISSQFEPIVLYEIPGTYNVSLTAYNQAGQDVFSISSYITISASPVSTFNYTTNGLQVSFNSGGSEGNSFFWTFGDGGVSTLPNPVHTYTSGGQYIVKLTVQNDCGSAMFQLTINLTGAPMAQFSSNTQYGCAPLLVQFTNQSGGNPTQFSWVFQGGIPGTSNLPNPLVTYNIPGTYDVQLTVTNSSGSDILILDDYIEVEYPTESDFGQTVNGSVVNFINQSSNAFGFNWNFGDGQTSNVLNPTHQYTQDGNYLVTLISTGPCGTDTSTSIVTIQTPPFAEFSFQQQNGCVPSIVLFNNLSSSNATSFAWSFPGGTPSTSTEVNPTVVYNVPGTFGVTLIAYSLGGSDTLIWPDMVIIGPAAIADFLLSTSDLTVNLTNQSTGASSFFWSFGDGQSSTSQNPSHTYDGFGTYTITLIALNACGSDTSTVVIELSDQPNAFFTYTAHSGCAPFEIQFLDQSQNNPTSWLWTFDGGDPATSTLQNPIVLYATPGIHTVTLQATNGQGTDVLILDGLVKIGAIPDATFLYNVVDGNKVILEYPGLVYDSLRWEFGDGRTDNSLNPTAEYTVSGQYLISLIVYNPCGSDTAYQTLQITVTSTNDPYYNASGWQIRPNPFNDVLTIFGQPAKEGIVNVSLIDVHGRSISREKWIHPKGQAIKEIDASSLPAGVIMVLIQDEYSRVILKAVHQ